MWGPNPPIAEWFGLCELLRMDIAALRKDLGLSQEAFAVRIGLSSKGHVSQLERGEIRPSVRVALNIEQLSGGAISASNLNDDVAAVRAVANDATPQDVAA